MKGEIFFKQLKLNLFDNILSQSWKFSVEYDLLKDHAYLTHNFKA
jgi:hypothetical protein